MLYPASNYFLSQFTQRDNWVATSYPAELSLGKGTNHPNILRKTNSQILVKELKQLGLLL